MNVQPVNAVVMHHLDNIDKFFVEFTEFIRPILSNIYFRDSKMHESSRWPDTTRIINLIFFSKLTDLIARLYSGPRPWSRLTLRR